MKHYNMVILDVKDVLSTYGHSQLKTGHPVRSAIHKQLNGRLVLRWVTTWESLLLYVLFVRSNLFAYRFALLFLGLILGIVICGCCGGITSVYRRGR
jgi:hypothetical protein